MKIVAFVTEPASQCRTLALGNTNPVAQRAPPNPTLKIHSFDAYPLTARSCCVLNLVNRLR